MNLWLAMGLWVVTVAAAAWLSWQMTRKIRLWIAEAETRLLLSNDAIARSG